MMVVEMRRLIRGAGLVLGAVIGYQIADAVRFEIVRSGGEAARLGTLAAGIVLGALLGAAVSRPIAVRFVSSMGWALRRLGEVPLRDVVSGAVGLLAGLFAAFLVSIPLQRVPIIGAYIIPIAAVLGFGYLGLHLGIQRREDALIAFTRFAEWIGRERQGLRLPSQGGGPGSRRRPGGVDAGGRPKLLDTSAIIDGRIADICRTGVLEGPLLVPRGVLLELGIIRKAEGGDAEVVRGPITYVDTSAIIDGRIVDIVASGFVSGTLVVPRFVLGELQHIADDSQASRRTRGRRGLDVLSVLQKDHRVNLELSDEDEPGTPTVDAKLVGLALRRDAGILTTDYNLNRVAQLQGVRILNVNQLANALKPAFLPGEPLRVKVIQEGKEPGQGVAFLDDGTMVVVEGGSQHISDELDVTVTRILQTVAGRMVFAELAPTAAGA